MLGQNLTAILGVSVVTLVFATISNAMLPEPATQVVARAMGQLPVQVAAIQRVEGPAGSAAGPRFAPAPSAPVPDFAPAPSAPAPSTPARKASSRPRKPNFRLASPSPWPVSVWRSPRSRPPPSPRRTPSRGRNRSACGGAGARAEGPRGLGEARDRSADLLSVRTVSRSFRVRQRKQLRRGFEPAAQLHLVLEKGSAERDAGFLDGAGQRSRSGARRTP